MRHLGIAKTNNSNAHLIQYRRTLAVALHLSGACVVRVLCLSPHPQPPSPRVEREAGWVRQKKAHPHGQASRIKPTPLTPLHMWRGVVRPRPHGGEAT